MTFEEGVRAMTDEAFADTIAQWTAQEKRLRAEGHVAAADQQAQRINDFQRARAGEKLA
jgi:hypothetical protein